MDTLTPHQQALLDRAKSGEFGSGFKSLASKASETKTLSDTVTAPTLSPITTSYTPTQTLEQYLTSNYNPEAETIMGRYNQARAGVSEAASYGRQLTQSKAGSDIAAEYEQGQQTLKDAAEGRRGFATNTALIRSYADETRKRVADLQKNMNELLLQNKYSEAASLSDLILKEQTSLTEARTNYLNEYFAKENLNKSVAEFQFSKEQANNELLQQRFQNQIAGKQLGIQQGQFGIQQAEEGRNALAFRTPEQQSALEIAQNLAQTFPDAGISISDDPATAQIKVRNSDSYRLNQRASEASIAQAYAAAAYTRAQTGKVLTENEPIGLSQSSSPLMSQPSYGLLTAKQRTQADSVNNLVTALNDYKSYMKQTTGGFGQNLFGSDAAVLQTKLNAIIFAAAQAEGTGALQQADREVITRMIPDPTSGSGAWNVMRTGGLQGSINKIDDQINKYTGQLNNYGLQPGYQLMQQQSGVQQGPTLTINPINGSYTMPSSTAQTLTSTVRAPDGNDIIIID